jgi:hypothetical protein
MPKPAQIGDTGWREIDLRGRVRQFSFRSHFRPFHARIDRLSSEPLKGLHSDSRIDKHVINRPWTDDDDRLRP